jgi:hypothetical protein
MSWMPPENRIRIKMIGHVCVFVGCVCCTPTGNHTDQPPTNFAQAPSGAGCAQLAALAIAPPPPEGAASSQRTQLQNKLYIGIFRLRSSELYLFSGLEIRRVRDLNCSTTHIL